MKLKTLRPIAAALVVASLTPAVMAETLGEHPAMQVARTWSTHGIDTNTFIVGHPAGLQVGAAVSSTLHSAPSIQSADAQAQAAALLSRPVVSGTSKASDVRSASRVSDAQASAAALLSGSRVRTENAEAIQVSDGRVTGDAQSQAAALLSGASAPADVRRSPVMSSKVGL